MEYAEASREANQTRLDATAAKQVGRLQLLGSAAGNAAVSRLIGGRRSKPVPLQRATDNTYPTGSDEHAATSSRRYEIMPGGQVQPAYPGIVAAPTVQRRPTSVRDEVRWERTDEREATQEAEVTAPEEEYVHRNHALTLGQALGGDEGVSPPGGDPTAAKGNAELGGVALSDGGAAAAAAPDATLGAHVDSVASEHTMGASTAPDPAGTPGAATAPPSASGNKTGPDEGEAEADTSALPDSWVTTPSAVDVDIAPARGPPANPITMSGSEPATTTAAASVPARDTPPAVPGNGEVAASAAESPAPSAPRTKAQTGASDGQPRPGVDIAGVGVDRSEPASGAGTGLGSGWTGGSHTTATAGARRVATGHGAPTFEDTEANDTPANATEPNATEANTASSDAAETRARGSDITSGREHTEPDAGRATPLQQQLALPGDSGHRGRPAIAPPIAPLQRSGLDSRSAHHPAPDGAVATLPGSATAEQAPAGPAEEPADESIELPESEPEVQPTSVMVGSGGGGGGGGGGDGGSGELPSEPTPEQQAQQITADSSKSEDEINTHTATRRSEMAAQFGAVRRRVGVVLATSSRGIQTFLSERQAEMQSVTSMVFSSGQALLTSTMQTARGSVQQARSSLDGVVHSATSTLAAQVGSAAGRITGLVDRLNLPNLPGMSAIRSGARALVGRAAGAVTAGLNGARQLISSVLRQATRMLTSALTAAEQAAVSAVNRIRGIVQQALQAVLGALRRAGTALVNGLRTALSVTVLRGLDRSDRALTGHLSTAQRQALRSVRTNRDLHLQAVREGRAAADGTRNLAAQSRRNTASVVTTFRERTSSILTSVFGALATGAAALTGHIGQFVGRAVDLVRAPLSQIVGQLRQVGQALAGFLSSLLGELTAAVSTVVGFLRSAVQQPLGTALRFATGAVTRVGQFLSGLASRLLRGNFSLPGIGELIGDARASGGPIVKPPPGPILKPALQLLALVFLVVGAIVLHFAPSVVAAIAAALVALGITVSPAVLLVIVGVVVVVAVALALLALYLLYRLLKPGPKPPPPVITHATDFPAPDGSANTRTDVGVGERVVFMGSSPGSWTASAGSPRRGTGTTFTWTAPERRRTVTIRLTVGRATASQRLSVVEPSSITAHKLSELPVPPGQFGAGMMLDFEFHPLRVSFGNVGTREVEGPASAIRGYYRRFGKKFLRHNPGPVHFFRIAANNRFAAAQDKASWIGQPSPFSDGSFHWKIPNKFRVITETGDGKRYTTVIQEFGMEASGKARVDKAGAHVEHP